MPVNKLIYLHTCCYNKASTLITLIIIKMQIYIGLTSCLFLCVASNPQNPNFCLAFTFPNRMLVSLTCTVKFVDSFERRRTSANAMVKPFSMLSLKLQKRMSMCLGTNCRTGEQGKFNILYYNRKSLQTEE